MHTYKIKNTCKNRSIKAPSGRSVLLFCISPFLWFSSCPVVGVSHHCLAICSLPSYFLPRMCNQLSSAMSLAPSPSQLNWLIEIFSQTKPVLTLLNALQTCHLVSTWVSRETDEGAVTAETLIASMPAARQRVDPQPKGWGPGQGKGTRGQPQGSLPTAPPAPSHLSVISQTSKGQGWVCVCGGGLRENSLGL